MILSPGAFLRVALLLFAAVVLQLSGIDGLTVAAGFSGHGFALSPITGQLVSELLLDGRPSLPLDAFGAERFAGMDVDEGALAPSAG